MKNKLALILVTMMAIFAAAIPASATSYSTPSVHADDVTFDACAASSFTLSYTIHHDYTAEQSPVYLTSYWNVNGALAVTEFTMQPQNNPGATFPWSFVFVFAPPQAATYTFDWFWETYDGDGNLLFVSRVSGTCVWDGMAFVPGEFTVTHAPIHVPPGGGGGGGGDGTVPDNPSQAGEHANSHACEDNPGQANEHRPDNVPPCR
jgi:hypothetical protein